MTGMISGSKGRRLAEWLEGHVDGVWVDGRYCVDATPAVLARYPVFTQSTRIASYFTILPSLSDVRVHWASLVD